MEAAAFICITVNGFQENLVDDGSDGLRVCALVVVYVVRLRDSLLLQHVKRLELVRWSVESRDYRKSLDER